MKLRYLFRRLWQFIRCIFFLTGMAARCLNLYIITCAALAKAALVMGPLRPSVHPSVRSQHFWET